MRKLPLFILLDVSLIIGLAVISTGCSSSSSQPDASLASSDKMEQVQNLSLFMRRSSLNGTDFEHFKLLGPDSLYVECGKIKGGRYFVAYTQALPISTDALRAISQPVQLLLENGGLSSDHFEEPGKKFSLFDPGEFALTLKTPSQSAEVTTSLDTVSEPETRTTRDLKSLATTLRRVVVEAAGNTDPICHLRDFYQIKL